MQCVGGNVQSGLDTVGVKGEVGAISFISRAGARLVRADKGRIVKFAIEY